MHRLGRIRLEDIAVVLVLMFFGMAGSIPGIAPNQANEMTGAAATKLQTIVGVGTQLLVNGIIVLLLLRHCRMFERQQAMLRWASVLGLWAVSSTLWSQAPLLTARRSIPFALATAFGMFLALHLPQRKLLLLLQTALALLACWSAALALGFPSIGLDASTGHGGDWQGVFTQKNACGRAMVFAVAAVLAHGRLSFARVALLLLFAAELTLSGSRGAWLLGGILVLCLLLFRASCRFDRETRIAFFAVTGVSAIGIAAVATLQFANLAALLGRDPTLTGRTAIWHEVWISILNRPILGYGFSAFWQGAQGASWSVVVALKFVLFHAHNGFLEVWLELGGAGLLLFALGFARGAFLLWPELRAGRYANAAWPLAVLLFIALYNVDENTLLTFNGLFWVLYTAALVRIELLAAERKAAHGAKRNGFARRWIMNPLISMRTPLRGASLASTNPVQRSASIENSHNPFLLVSPPVPPAALAISRSPWL